MAKHSRGKSIQVNNRLASLEKLAFDEMSFVKSEMDKQKTLFDEMAQLKDRVKQLIKLISLREREYKNLLKRHKRFLASYNKMRSAVNKDITNNA